MEAVYVSFDRPDVAAVKIVKGPWMLRSFAATLRQEALRRKSLSGILNLVCRWIFSSEVRNRLEHLKLFLERKALPA